MTADKQMPELNDRAQHILKVLVEDYIQDGQPVGSRKLAKSSGLAPVSYTHLTLPTICSV